MLPLIALAQAAVALKAVKLKTFAYPPPQYPEVTGQYVASYHRCAGFNFLFVVPEDEATKFVFDEEAKSLYIDRAATENSPKYYFTISNGEFWDKGTFLNSIETSKGTKVHIDNLGFVTFDGSFDLKAVKNINERYEYSKEKYALVEIEGSGPDGTIPVFLQATEVWV